MEDRSGSAEVLIADDQPAELWFAELIAHIALAGACEHWTRREPLAGPGLAKIADRERGLAAGLWEENLGAQDRTTLVLGAFNTSPLGLRGAVQGGDVNGVGAAGP